MKSKIRVACRFCGSLKERGVEQRRVHLHCLWSIGVTIINRDPVFHFLCLPCRFLWNEVVETFFILWIVQATDFPLFNHLLSIPQKPINMYLYSVSFILNNKKHKCD